MKSSLIFLLAVLFVSCVKKAEPVSEWRGPNRSGIYAETGLLTEWPAGGPQLLWSVDSTGRGYGSPVFTDDQFFINGETDSAAFLYAYALDGKLHWKTVNPKPEGMQLVSSFKITRGTSEFFSHPVN